MTARHRSAISTTFDKTSPKVGREEDPSMSMMVDLSAVCITVPEENLTENQKVSLEENRT